MIGQPTPSPISDDQSTFLVGENSAGMAAFEVEIPLQLGPRNCAQSSAWAVVAASRPAARNVQSERNMVSLPV